MKKACLVLLVFSFALSSCVKVVETIAIIGTWKVDKYYENGTDKTADFNTLLANYRIKFEANGSYTETANTLGLPLTVTGPWVITGSNLKLTNDADNSVRNFGLSFSGSQKMTLKEGSTKEYRLVKL